MRIQWSNIFPINMYGGAIQRIVSFIVGVVLISGCGKSPEESDQKPPSTSDSSNPKSVQAAPSTSVADAEAKLMEQFKAFAIRKRDYAKKIAVEQKVEPPQVAWDFFEGAIDENFLISQKKYEQLSNQFGRGKNRADVSKEIQDSIQPVWVPAKEVFGAMEAVDGWHAKFLLLYMRDIVGSIPKDSIYFGGTDPGRFAITLGSLSHEKANPFFTITQTLWLMLGIYSA